MIEYTVLENPLTTPPTFRPEVVTKQTIPLRDLIDAAAQETAQSPEAVLAAFTVVFDKVRAALDDGNGILWEDTFQIEPTLKGKLVSPTDDLPADATFGISISFIGAYLAVYKAAASAHRVAAASKAPSILEVVGLNADLQHLLIRDLIAIRGDRLGFDPAAADEGIYLDPVAGGASIKVPAASIVAHGEKEARIQWPGGVTALAEYKLRLEARRRGKGMVRHDIWQTPVKAA